MSSSESEFEAYARTRIGKVLREKYTLDGVIGLGGMAVVYKATHRNQAEFAVKMLHPELSIRAEVRTRFVREGYAANSVKHPGVVLVVDDDVADDGAAFLVMELLHGVPCDVLLERCGGSLPGPVAIAIVHQLLDVLAAAHAKGIVHRDLKPANLFVTPERLKVLDFGIARFRDVAVNSATMSGMVLGTPAFMPPEQAMASSNDIDALTDLWAVGATLFTMLCGRFVHEGENATQIMIKAATQPARSLASAAPHLPPGLIQFVDRALAFDKRNRWPDAAVMRTELERVCITAFGESPNPVLLGRYATPAPVVAAVAAGASTDLSSMAGRAPPAPGAPRAPFPAVPTSDRTLPIADPRSEREIVAAAASMRMAGSTTTGGLDAPSLRAVEGARRGRSPARWLVPVGIAALLATGAGIAASGAGLFKGGARSAASTAAAMNSAEASPAATPSTSTIVDLPSGAPVAPSGTSGVVGIAAPPDARIDLDGKPVEARDGGIEIGGAVGSVHAVRVTAGGRESKTDVTLTTSGPVPPRIDARGALAIARGGPSPRTAPPAGSQTGSSAASSHVGSAPSGVRFNPAGL